MMFMRRSGVAVIGVAAVVAAAVPVVVTAGAAAGAEPRAAQRAEALHMIRSFATVELGIKRPTGLAWSWVG